MYKRGISLTALVVTVIIMILLAGISMTALFGDNGVIKQAMKSKENTEYAAAREMVELAWSARMTKFLEEGNAPITPDYLEQLKIDLNANLGSSGKIIGDIEYEEETNTFRIMYQNSKGNNFAINITRSGQASILGQAGQDVTEENANEILEEYKPKTKVDRVSLYGQGIYTGVSSVQNGGETIALTTNVEDLETVVPEIEGDSSTYNWKVFYIDSNNVYLIYRDYYPNKAMTITGNIEHGEGIADAMFDIRVSNSGETSNPRRDELIAYLSNTNYWSNIVDSFTESGKPFAGYSNRIVAYGSPDAKMWIDSFNEKNNENLGYILCQEGDEIENYIDYDRNGNSQIYTRTVTVPGAIFSLNRSSEPYSKVLTDSGTNSENVGMDTTDGYAEGGGTSSDTKVRVKNDDDKIYLQYGPFSDNMYYSRKGSVYFNLDKGQTPYTYGYWLRTPSIQDNESLSAVFCIGSIGIQKYYDGILSVRPIVQIPRDVFEDVMHIEIQN